MMNVSHIESYNNISIDELLNRQLKSPCQNTWVFVLAKARIQQCTQESIKMTLMLLQRDGDKWLQILKRFSYLQFKLVFSFCIKRMKTYLALIQSVYKLGEPQHQRMLQQNIQKTIDGQRIDSSINSNQLWTLYLSYLSEWISNLPHRTLYALEKIQRRMSNQENIYDSLVDRQKIQFIKVLCEIIKFHQQGYMKRLELRKFWQSIPNTIIFLQQTLYHKDLIYKVVNSLDTFDNKPQAIIGKMEIMTKRELVSLKEHNQLIEKDKQMMVMLLMKSSQVTILQDIFIRCTRLATVLLKVQIIDYSKYNKAEQLQRLESSLIYHIRSDDLPSLISQLLVSLSINIPNFLTLFVSQCLFYLRKDTLDEIITSDIILKLCILSKLIIEHTQLNSWDFSIKDLVDRLIVLSDSRSQIIQVKTLLMMHYFKEILPQSYFMQYHSVIFRILKYVIKQSIENNKKNQHNNKQLNYAFNFQPFKYTMISYSQCIKILQQETQKKQDNEGMEMKIRKKKFINNKYVNDLFRNHVLQLADKLIDLISIEGYCEEQTKILQILRNFLLKYPIVQQRNTLYLIKILTKQFMCEYDRLRQLNMRDKKYSKILMLLQCIELVWNEVTQQTYFQCQQHMIPIIQLLKQQYTLQFQDQIVKLIGIMIVKANMITPQLNNFIIYSKAVLKNSQGSLMSIQTVIKELCRTGVVKSIREEWRGLITYVTNIFNEYLSHTINNQTMQLYHKDWVQSSHLIQLFIQTYAEDYQFQQQLLLTLYNMQSILCSSSPNQQINQLLMTIYHITQTTKTKTNYNMHQGHQLSTSNAFFKQINSLNLYQQKYSLHLLQLTMLDTLNINLRKHLFDFSQPHNPLYPFLQSYKTLTINIQDLLRNLSSTPNDLLPFNKINLIQYITVILDSLRKDKLIDIQQFTQLKSIFLPQNYLISYTLFQ